MARSFIPIPLFRFLQPVYHYLLAFLAAIGYGFPSRYLTVIGVTGTDGKTTVVHFMHEMFAAAGHRVGSLSSLRFKINEREEPNFLKMTMPGRFRLQKFLRDCVHAGCRYAVIEVTSQGIKQFRHRFVRFRAAVLTNVTLEHVEDHGGFERYRSAKIELFRCLAPGGIAVLNREDASAERFASATPARRIVWYERSVIELGGVGWPVRVLRVEPERIQLEIENTFLESGLGGEFNVMNILAAAAAALAFGVSLSAVAQALGRVKSMPGRLEYIQREPFAVVVDYANTPAAYAQVYQTLTGRNPESLSRARSRDEIPARLRMDEVQAGGRNPKLICVFGAPGGGRDKWKRPEIGKIATRYCREIILTSDDPDDEDPARIVSEIRAGMTNDQLPMTKAVIDRREAIRQALRDARPGDTVIVTGMGAQPWQVIKGKKIPWDDRKVVREELARLNLKR